MSDIFPVEKIIAMNSFNLVIHAYTGGSKVFSTADNHKHTAS